MNSGLPALRSFVLPGSSRLNAELHQCRTVCRRAERTCVKLARREKKAGEILPYLNRLGDAFFVWSRWVSVQLGKSEVFWDPNQTASGEMRE
jgi:cob(I)alamin adenosyltransferase